MIKTHKYLRQAFLCAALVLPPFAVGKNAEDFPAWLKAVRAEAAAKGISKKVIDDALPDSLRPIPRVIELDRKQPEGTKTLQQYLSTALSDTRISNGQQHIQTHQEVLSRVSGTYNVEAEVIVALWGLETAYGKLTGGFNVINALATLAYDGRRSEFFRGELINAMKILDQEDMKSVSLKGSWAGAMGQCQFMPSSYLRLAVDFNGDHKRDIWDTTDDVFASAANYLNKSGWKKNEIWGRGVTLPEGFDRKLLGLDTRQTIDQWKKVGVILSTGVDIPLADSSSTVSIIQPDGPNTAAYIVYDNFRTILKWNRSNYFALSVGLLSDQIRIAKLQPTASVAVKPN